MIKTSVFALAALLACVGLAPLAMAEPPEPPGLTADPGNGSKTPPAQVNETGEQWGDGKVAPGPRPGKEPAKGASYNWTQMGFGVVIMLVMLAFVIRLVRRTKRVADE